MTIIVPAHRALTSKLAGRSYQVVTRYGYNPWLVRVNQTSSSNDDIKSTSKSLLSCRIGLTTTRTYATSTTKAPVGRPKAHTGRAPARKTSKAKAAAAKKPGPKTAAGKSKVGRKPKPKTKAKAKKPATKPKVKKPLSKSALTQKRRTEERELKAKALLDTPKTSPASAWGVFFKESQEAAKGNSRPVSEVTREAAANYKTFTPEQKEHYNHIAHQNKEKNETAYKKWLSQFTPTQIKEANTARRLLATHWAAKNGKSTKGIKKFPAIQDDRLVKHPKSPYIFFNMDRQQSGDFHKMTLKESASLVSREWKALDAPSKKKYIDAAQADHNRYVEEIKSVYGIDWQPRKAAAS